MVGDGFLFGFGGRLREKKLVDLFQSQTSNGIAGHATHFAMDGSVKGGEPLVFDHQ